MKSLKSGSAVLIVLLLVFILPSDARSDWLLTSGEEIIVLMRVDTGDPDSPLHEETEGKYGYWADSENFVVVIDFEGGSGPVLPFTWNDVKWVPGPMGKD